MSLDCDCDYSAVWDERKLRARKEHRCSECHGTIKRGETYTRIASLYDGRWTTIRRCEDCSVILCDLGRLTTGGCHCYTGGDLMADLHEHAWECRTVDKRAVKAVFAAFNAASKARGGRLLSMEPFTGVEDQP